MFDDNKLFLLKFARFLCSTLCFIRPCVVGHSKMYRFLCAHAARDPLFFSFLCVYFLLFLYNNYVINMIFIDNVIFLQECKNENGENSIDLYI